MAQCRSRTQCGSPLKPEGSVSYPGEVYRMSEPLRIFQGDLCGSAIRLELTIPRSLETKMKILTPFGIVMVQFYLNAVLSNPAIVHDCTYLFAVDGGADTKYEWIDDCNNHEEARARGMCKLATENDGAEYGVVGPCNSECTCGRVRCRTYFTDRL